MSRLTVAATPQILQFGQADEARQTINQFTDENPNRLPAEAAQQVVATLR